MNKEDVQKIIGAGDDKVIMQLLVDAKINEAQVGPWFYAAKELRHCRKPKLALGVLRKAIDIYEISGRVPINVLFLEGDLHLDLKNFDLAIDVYNTITEREENDIAHVNLGLAFWEKANYGEALNHYLLAISLNGNNFVAQRGSGEMLLLLGDPAKALTHFSKALEIKPDYSEACTGCGICHYQLGDWPEAYRMFQGSLTLDPNDERAKRGIDLLEEYFGL